MASTQYRNLSGAVLNDSQQRSSSGFSGRGGQSNGSSGNLNKSGPSNSNPRPHSAGATRSRGSTLGTYAHVHPNNSSFNNAGNNTANPPSQLNRSNTGTTNTYANTTNINYSNGVNNPIPSQPISSVGLTGQGYAAPTFSSANRPSSAGISRTAGPVIYSSNPAIIPVVNNGTVAPATTHIPVSMHNVNNNIQPNFTAPAATNINIQQNQSNAPSQRPRSAGAIRPSGTHIPVAGNPTGVLGNPLYPYNNINNSTNSNPNILQQGAKQPQSGQQQQPMVQQTGQPYYTGYMVNPSSAAPSNGRPLSANATAHADNWSASYKLMYSGGPNISNTKPTAPSNSNYNSVNTSNNPANIPQESTSSKSNSTSTPAVKLRNAVDLSHRLDNTQLANEAAARASQLAANAAANVGEGKNNNVDEDGDAFDLDAIGDSMNMNHRATSHIIRGKVPSPSAQNNTATVLTTGDDDEMDGKPINESRSHPEVSTTTPSQSVELQHGGGSSLALGGALDGRGEDSLTEDMINIGISTVPNQFCSKRDALELRKLLMLSFGTRGGIVPSSSAVMDMYMVGKVVGVGSYGKVRAAWHRLTGSKVAIKTYDKAKLKDPAHWKRVHSEIKIMEQISHPRIARMYEAVETPKRMHLIMECLDGGNLCSYVKAKRRLSEEESKRIFFQILQAIDHLHDLGVSHRDVKLENVLFVDDKDIKLIDFGFSTVCQPGKKLKVFCGTPSYMAPEIVRRSEYDGKPVDIWSMGILLYALLCGCFPFRAKAYPDLYRRIARGTFAIPDELSVPVKDLLRQLLNVDAATRITAHHALRHPWLQVQLLNAPNIDKMRLETTILISEKPSDDLDDQVLSELEKFGIAKDELIRLVLTKTHSSLSTLYYLLLDTLIRRRRSLAKKSSASMQGGMYNMVKGVHSSSNNNGTPAGVGVGSSNSSNSGSVNGTANASNNAGNVVQNVNAVAAAATYSLSQRYKNVAGSQPQYNNSNTNNQNYTMNGDAIVAESNATIPSSTQQQQQQQQPVPLNEYVGSSNTTASRPTSASGVRTSASGAPPQRPLSAYAMRR